MKTLKRISLIAGTVSTFSLGLWLGQPQLSSPLTTADTSDAELQTPTSPQRDTFTVPSFPFSQPFDPRRELDHALSLDDETERYGRMIAIGCYAARQNPKRNLAILSPDIWHYPNYDLRGAFHSEWMRTAPDSFLEYSEAKYKTLSEENQTKLYPSYHLSYMEPMALLELLPKVENQRLKNRLRSDLLGTLIELDPSLLWENRELVASPQAIIDEASAKSLFDLALQFWELTDWEEISFGLELHDYIAQNQLLSYASKLQGYERTTFAVSYAAAHPAAAADWVRQQGDFHDISYEFDSEHAPFFKHLFASKGFAQWEDAGLWICEGISADSEQQNHASIFRTIKAAPEHCHIIRLKEEFTAYLHQVEDLQSIKSLYLSLQNDHPILETLERFMLQSDKDFSDAIVTRTTREAPTPERLMQVLEIGKLEVWPPAYLAAAKETLNSLSEEQLLWSLSPGMILSAQEIAPDRIQNLISSADPTWVYNTLGSYEFTSNAIVRNLDQLPHLLKDLPPEKAQNILESARTAALQQSLFDPNKIAYLGVAQTPSETLIVANSIELSAYLEDKELKQAIDSHPFHDDIYLSIASNSLPDDYPVDDPKLNQALARIEKGRELSKKSPYEAVSSIQSLPDSERLLTAKAFLLAKAQTAQYSGTEELIKLPIWSESERQQLQTLGFTHLVNQNIDYSSEIIW
ncbi:hypothetical protein QEH56_11170 [Pelagicoccus enzymogenes]|uniref:hypothetical protein n=1 Tax=Pelagicoccus enzymogenes TaxID=2773457 RepID=UPI00280DD354|nr:hypothetical protein [Pelagicoccus enzymogenes]MDQ8198715.1 hypothetical protein [Pelagicoccus enzymogenes]